MSERICVATVDQEEIDELQAVFAVAKRVHKSLPQAHPAREASRQLSQLLERYNRRGVTIETLAETLGVSHQAVRTRIQKVRAEHDELPTDVDSVLSQRTVETPDEAGDVVLVLDAGIHRRLRVYDEPTTLDYVIPSLPVLGTSDVMKSWLETESEVIPAQRSRPTATPLRIPAAVYVQHSLADTVLAELTSEGEKT